MRKDKQLKRLHNKASQLWKEVCRLRDGDCCQVQKNFPHIQVKHSQVLQVDHCFSRTNKHLFYEPSNGTVVCSACNLNKKLRNKAVDVAIEEIVKLREGQKKFDEMRDIYLESKPNIEFNYYGWLEDQIYSLEATKNSYTQIIQDYATEPSFAIT